MKRKYRKERQIVIIISKVKERKKEKKKKMFWTALEVKLIFDLKWWEIGKRKQ